MNGPQGRRPPKVVLSGPGREVPGAVSLVADLRSVELSAHPLVGALRARTGPVAHEALALARALRRVLPEEVAARPDPRTPSLWECVEHEFARYSLAPALLNLELAKAALEEASGLDLALVERADGRWWLGGSGAEEAAREAARQAGRRLRLEPGGALRALRRLALPYAARRAPRRGHGLEPPRAEEQVRREPVEVAFACVAATSVPILARIAEGLRQVGLSSAMLDFHRDHSTEALRQTDLRIVDARPERYGGEEAAAWARAQAGRWWRQGQSGVRQLVREGALPGWVAPQVERRLAVALAREVPELAAHRVAAGRLLEDLQPHVFVGLHFLPDFLAPLLLSAQARGVPTAWHQHGIRGPVHRNGAVLPWGTMLAWGQYTADLYADLVPPGSRWVVTGNGLYDEVTAEAPGTATAMRARLRLGQEPVVLAATQTDEAQTKARQERWWLRGVAEACQGLGAALVVKLHPHERERDLYAELEAEFPERVRVLAHGELSLGEGLAMAGVLVVRDSTVAYDAALRGKAVVAVTLWPEHPRFPLAEHGGAIGVARYEEIGPALREALEGGEAAARLAERRAGFLEYHLGPQDGGATGRIVEELRRLAQAGGEGVV